jgi:phospho-N-acetylmuramoyl-pentapeptide-transferase
MIDVENKASTPSMGGIVFIVISIFLCISGEVDNKIWLFAIACGSIGFIDDWLKLFHKSSEGFSSLKKLFLQIIFSSIYVLFVSINYDIKLWGDFSSPVWLSIPLLIFFSVGLQNAVNVTDGLDGLAAGTVSLSLVALVLFMGELNYDIAVALGMAIGFLWHNSHPAKVFMGDVGSHFLAGLLIAIILFNGSILLLLPLSFLFGIEIITSAIQIFSIRKYKRKIFRMAPLHHHFQFLGWEETLIVNRFYIVHICGMALLYAVFSGVL